MNDKILNLVKSCINKVKFNFPYEVEDYAKNLYVENYHSHKMGSNVLQADCAESIENYAKTSLEYGSKCLFSGEHGWQGDQFGTYEVAQNTGLKYRHSVEAYWVKDRLEKDRTNCHMMIVAKNPEGRKDINYILSLASQDDSYYYKARIDLSLLLAINPNNIIVTSACVGGWSYEDSEELWLKVFEHFKDNFFLEIQYHDTDKQKDLNKKIVNMSKKYGIQLILGMDSHFVDPKNKVKRDKILERKGIKYPEEDGWYMDFPNGKEALKRLVMQKVLTPEQAMLSLMNTNVFVNECEEIIFDTKFKIPNIYKDLDYNQRVEKYKDILKRAYAKEQIKSNDKLEGIKYEVEQVADSGVVDYFLLNQKIVETAVNVYNGILTPTSRGSSASFITNKLLGLTTIDRFNCEIPIYPERFLTKERVLSGQMPDIDFNTASPIPFVQASRDLIGEHGVYPLMAIDKLGKKSAWKMYAGVNNVSPTDADIISKSLEKYDEKIKYADEEDKDYIFIEDFIPEEYIGIYNQSLEYNNITIGAKAHACGYLLFDGDIRREIGLIRLVSESTKKSTLCACIEGGYLDKYGYVKDDFLIVDTVALSYKLYSKISNKIPSFDELREMVSNDNKTWEIYEKGITCCVNQYEKQSTSNKSMTYKPKNLSESAAFIAGIRPGFRSLIDRFLSREPYSTGVKELDILLEDSFHYLLYQESIMKLLSYLGLPMAQSYETIKKISKKKFKEKELSELKSLLRNGWREKIGDETEFDVTWNTVENFAKYGFNSPHALSMAGDSAYIAYFKAHHTSIFYREAIKHYQEKLDKNKIKALLNEATTKMGYKLSSYKFGVDNRELTVDDSIKTIYPCIGHLKGFNVKIGYELYEISKFKPKNVLSLFELLEDISIDKSQIKSLFIIDYFSNFGKSNFLIKAFKVYKTYKDSKIINKDKLEREHLVHIIKNSSRETEKQYRELNNEGLIKDIISEIERKDVHIKIKIKEEINLMGYPMSTLKNIKDKLFYVMEIKEYQGKYGTTRYPLLYNVKTGEIVKYKVGSQEIFAEHSFEVGDMIRIMEEGKKAKMVDGKKSTTEFNNILEYWNVI